MYGTVARYRIKPGSEEALKALSGELGENPPPGFVAGFIYRLDAGGDEYITAAMYSDRETYRRNSEDERQKAWFARVSELVAGETEWHDGEVISAVGAVATPAR